MCYTRVVTKEKGNCSVTDKRYNIYKEDIKMAVVKLTTDNFEQEVLGAKVPVVIDFWAVWCGPCQMQSPILDQVAEEFGDKIKVCKVNVDEQPSLALNYQIASIPTLVFMKYGLFQQRMIGLQDKQTITDYLQTLLDAE